MPTPFRGVLDGLPSYEFGVQDVPGVDRVIQLGQNELGVPPSPRAIEAAARATGDLNRYPDLEHGRLRRAIAEVHGLASERILCGAGSMELMGLLVTAYCEPRVEVVVSRFGYKYFELQCAVAGAALRVAPEPEWRVDVDAVLDSVTDRTRLVYVVNPANPTGACLEDGGLARLRVCLPERVMLVVDGAYAEFAAGAGYENGLDLVDAGRNVVVLRTFSKAYGLAGLRVGWMYAPDDVVDAVARVRPPNTVTPAGLAAAEAALADREHLDRVIGEVARLRESFRRHVRTLGLEAGFEPRQLRARALPRGRAARCGRGVRTLEERRHPRPPDRWLRTCRLPSRHHRVGGGDGGDHAGDRANCGREVDFFEDPVQVGSAGSAPILPQTAGSRLSEGSRSSVIDGCGDAAPGSIASMGRPVIRPPRRNRSVTPTENDVPTNRHVSMRCAASRTRSHW